MAFRVPDKSADHSHDEQLIEVEPALHEHRAERLHYELVVQTAHHTHECRKSQTPDPFIALEINVFLLARTAHQEDRDYGQYDTDPLVGVKPLTEDQHCSHKHKYRSCRIDRSDDGQRQVLQTEISADPRRQHDESLQDHQ